MLEFDGTVYHIDLKELDKLVNQGPRDLKETETTTYYNPDGTIASFTKTEKINHHDKVIDGTKFELIRMFIEIVTDSQETGDMDDSLGADRAFEKTTLSFKLAFNTLLEYNIIKES